jgi:uncharacterized membrane protein YfhO
LTPATIINYQADEVVIEASAPADGWLVLSDRFYPGWKAWLDQYPVDIYKANVFLRAVKFPAGQHRVVFKYQPASLRVGAAVSIPAWILALALWSITLIMTRRSQGHEG